MPLQFFRMESLPLLLYLKDTAVTSVELPIQWCIDRKCAPHADPGEADLIDADLRGASVPAEQLNALRVTQRRNHAS
jgi:hypothetical protein